VQKYPVSERATSLNHKPQIKILRLQLQPHMLLFHELNSENTIDTKFQKECNLKRHPKCKKSEFGMGLPLVINPPVDIKTT